MTNLTSLDERIRLLLDRVENTRGAGQEDRRAEMREMLRDFLITDPLTGSFNRQYLESALEELMESASGSGALISFDVDHFKQINDLYGHHTGDLALQQIAEGIQQGLRGRDALIRMGGDEFLLVLPDCGDRVGRTRAEEITSRIGSWVDLPDAGALQVTVSIGVLIPDPEEEVSADQMLERVDHALYTSKRTGRNRCTVWTPHLPRGIQMVEEDLVVTDPRTMRIQRDQARSFSLEVMSQILEAREFDTGLHSERVTRVTAFLVERMDIPPEQVRGILEGARLHDIGKVAVPDSILHKQEGLNASEQHIMRKHPEIGFRFVSRGSFLNEAAKVILHHHECWDGSGYPHGLKGEDIPIGARVFSVVDAYDSMRANRVYRASMTPEMAKEELKRGAGSQFDPSVVDLFLRHLEEVEEIGHWQGSEGE